MIKDDPVLRSLAERNPVRDVPPYDEAAEARLRQLLATFGTGPGKPRPARVSRPVLVTIGACAAVAVAAGVVAVNLHQQPATNTASPAHPSRPTTAAPTTGAVPPADASTPVSLVVDRSTVALNGAEDYLLKVSETINGKGAPDVSVSWHDEADQYNQRNQEIDPATGQVHFEYVQFDDNGSESMYGFNYHLRQYQHSVSPKVVARKPYVNDASAIAGNLAAGADKVIGMTTIDGRQTLELSNDEPGMNRLIWVDPSTYLPVRMTAHGSWGNYEMDYTWVARTPQSLAATFVPAVPAGFTKVAQISES